MSPKSRAYFFLPFAVFAWAGAAQAADAVAVRVTNPLGNARTAETIAVRFADAQKLVPGLDPGKTIVVDSAGKTVLSQVVDANGNDAPDELVFQSDFRAGESKSFTLQSGRRETPSPEQYKAFGRFARERHDDFAWENDRIAHRVYGPDLETWKKEPLTSSGIDVWTKRTRRLVVNEWYLTDDYHEDHGNGADFYSVGKSRGCGGLGIWLGDKLSVSKNFVRSRVFANGPVRLVFELDYAPWDAGDGTRVWETKRVTLDAGKSFDHFESTLTVEGKPRLLSVGIGIAKHPGGVALVDKKSGVLTSWEPLNGLNGSLGCGIVVAPKALTDYKETDTDFLLVTRGPVSYYAGFGWDRSGDVLDAADWTKRAQALAREVAAPVKTTLSAGRAVPSVQPVSWAERGCDSLIAEHPSVLTDKWDYDTGLELRACQLLGQKLHEKKYGAWVKRTIDGLVLADGSIAGYDLSKYNIDMINMGKVIFDLLEGNKDPKDKDRYRKALALLRSQMTTHPRTREGAFWHKSVYPNQMWLDGVFMASPFLARYGFAFAEPALFDEVSKQIALAEKHMREPKTGLLFHGWDESKKERWANPATGTSPSFWGRGMGWYAMAVVDVLEILPPTHPKRAALLDVLKRLATAIASVQDKASGTWWQVLDQPGRAKNYHEASASSMFVYALSKGVRNGWLDKATFEPVAVRGYQGILKEFAEVDAKGKVTLKSVCKVAGLGGNPYRDGSYDYYTSTEVVANDPKGFGAFILASLERE